MKNKRYIIKIINLIVLIFCMATLVACSKDKEESNNQIAPNIKANTEYFDIWDGSIAVKFAKGSGTKEDPYQISTGAELAYFAQLINDAEGDYKSAAYCLVNSIDLGGREWGQIGYSKYGSGSGINKTFSNVHCFSGIFDGKFCVIKNYSITTSKKQFVGFFGDLNGGTIQNLGLESFVFNCSNNTTQVYYVGGVVGFNRNGGSILNCYTDSDVKFTSTTDDVWVGGIVGNNNKANIENCFSLGDVSSIYRAKSWNGYSNSADANAGGIAAINSGSIKSCYSKGNITTYSSDGAFLRAGGIVGLNSSNKIENCYSTSDIYGSGDGQVYAGGLVGANLGGSIENSFATGNIFADAVHTVYVGGLTGLSEGRVENSYWSESQGISATGSSERYCNEGIKTNTSNIKSKKLQTDLGFGSNFNVADNLFPNLKNLPTTSSIKYGNKVKAFLNDSDFCLPIESRNGYLFNGWKEGETFITNADGNKLSTWNLSKDTICEASYTPIEYNADFYANDELVSSVKFTIEDTALDEPEVPKILGYEGKWQKYSIVAQNIKIDAEYDLIQYSISYVCDESITHGNPTKYTINSETYILNELYKKGYTFDGWIDNNDNVVAEITKGMSGDLVLTAKFTINQYSISFDSKGGSRVDTITQDYNSPVCSPEEPTRLGYDFVGWRVKNTGEEFEFSTMPSRDVELYACWSSANNYDIKYELNGGENNSANPVSYTVEDNVVLKDAEKIGHTFDGWYLESEFTTKVDSIPKGSTDDKTLYAKFTINQYKISFEENGGSKIEDIVQDYNSQVTEPQKPIKENYTFKGWFTDTGCTNEYVFNKMPAEDVLVYVKWIPYEIYEIICDENIVGVSEFKNINAETFNATCKDTDGNDIRIETKVVGTQEAGQIISVVLSAEAKGMISKKTLTNVKVFGNPSLFFDDSVTSFNYSEGVSKEWAKATGFDTYNNPTEIKVYVENEYSIGDNVTVIIESIDCLGHVTYGCLENIRVYGEPSLNIEKSSINLKCSTPLEASLFCPTSADTYGGQTEISVEIDTGFVNGDLYTYQTITEFDYKYFTAYMDGTYKLHFKNASKNARTRIYIYCSTTNSVIRNNYYSNYQDYSTISFSVKEGYEYYVRTCAYDDSFTNEFSMSLTSTEDVLLENIQLSKFAGKNVNIKVVATDINGNKTERQAKVFLYDIPIISNAEKTEFKVTDEITVEKLGITAEDSMGKNLSITLTVKEGEQKAGSVMTLTATVEDIVGNITEKDFTIKIYGAPVISYDKNALKVEEDPTLDSSFLNAQATDSFGNILLVDVKLNKGKFVEGNKVNYVLSATDHLGNASFLETKDIGVYDVNDIKIQYNDNVDKIKLISRGEEFNLKATDSFGDACDIQFIVQDGQLNAGKKEAVFFRITDVAGNMLETKVIADVKVYDVPKITINQDNFVINQDTNIELLFTVKDSFGDVIEYVVTDTDQSTSEYKIIRVEGVDAAGNEIANEYKFGIIPSSKSFVELYVDNEIWQCFFVEDSTNYTLSFPEVPNGFVHSVWMDKDGLIYTDESGTNVQELPSTIQLYLTTFPSRFCPIYSIEELKNIQMDKDYILFVDIDFDGEEWVPIGTKDSPYSGEFDANNHNISNFTLKDGTSVGFFGYNAGTIKNCTITEYSLSASSAYYVGALVGHNTGTLEGCSSLCKMTINSANSLCCGGLVGFNSGSIKNCYSIGDVSAGGASGSCCGGLVGQNAGSIEYCYATGKVTCSASESISNDNSGTSKYCTVYVGGLVGLGGNIYNSYATGDVLGQASSRVTQSSGIWANISAYAEATIIAGGLVGSGGNIYNSYARGNVNGRCSASAYATTYCTVFLEDQDAYASARGYVYLGGLAGKSSSISNSFATGDVSYNLNLTAIASTRSGKNETEKTYENKKVGPLVGDNEAVCNNSYRYNSQNVQNSTNSKGIVVDLSTLHSVDFLIDELKFEEIYWIIEDGKYPVLR